MDLNLKTLIAKLNDTTRTAATRAANICIGLGQYEVDVEHLLLALLEQPDCDLAVIARACDTSTTALETDLREEIARFPSGSARTPVFSRHLPLLLEHGWLLASLGEGGERRIRSGHLLQALLSEPALRQLAERASPLLARLPRERIKHDFARMTQASCEAVPTPAQEEDALLAQPERQPALEQFTISLTALAAEGKLDPVIGRDAEIRQAIDILMRRRQNNPILTGEAGVGKTAVVEGLAQRIARHEVPEVLQDVELRTLDLGLLQAGASVKGEFENRLKNVIDEVRRSPRPIILFVDEAHTLIGAGGTAGQNDAANLLKPALARGELRTIAATTWSEYKKYFEKDAALARRFQVIQVEEPDEDIACAMLRAMVPLMEQHFGVRVLDEAVVDAVRLSHRYIGGRQLPDKAVSVLDTACARVALGRSAVPPALEDATRAVEHLDTRIAALAREGGAPDSMKIQREQLDTQRRLLQQRWERERELAAKIEAGSAGMDALGDAPLVPVQVDAGAVANVVSSWTGVPLGRMVADDIRTVLSLEDGLMARVKGQPLAMKAVAQRIRTMRARLDDPDKPKAVFLFVGPSGVGKTETALTLAELLYGGERRLVTINMGEYQEAHSVSGLKGSPPGYVGYGEGGVLTEAVRRNPYSVVLLDEIEKAHGDVLELFYSVFDKGRMDDTEGRSVDFRNTIIIMTSNAGSALTMQACLNKPANELPSVAQLVEQLRPTLTKLFKPAFLGRCAVVPFYPIQDAVLSAIIGAKLERVAARIAAHHHAAFSYDASVVDAVLARCTEVDSGARNVDSILDGTLLPDIANALLARMAEGGAIARVHVTATKAGRFRYSFQ